SAPRSCSATWLNITMRPNGSASAAMRRPWYRRVTTPATVPDAYPPSPLVTSHSRVTRASGFCASTTGQGMRRRVSAIGRQAVREETQRKRTGRQDGAVEAAGALRGKRRVLAAEAQQVAMQRVHLGVRLALTEIEFAALERLRVAWIVECGARLVLDDAGELREEFSAAAPHGLGQPRVVVCEIQERRRRREFLPLKDHRRRRHQEEQRRHRAPAGRNRELMPASPAREIGHIIVLMQDDAEALR